MSNSRLKIVPKHTQRELFTTKFPTSHLRAGALRTKESVLEALKSALDNCGIPRHELAKEVSRLVGEEISVHMINNCCAEGKSNRRFPLELAKAVALVTQDKGLIEAALEPEFGALDDESRIYFEYGREVIESDRRSRKRNRLKKRATEMYERSIDEKGY